MDFPVTVEHGVSFSKLTTLGVGGPIRLLGRSRTASELAALLEVARGYELETFVLGGGSNLLASDRGFDGLVIQVIDQSIAARCDGGDVWLEVGAGLEWDLLVGYTVAIGLSGIECLSGIPGRVGAAPIQNIGAYGQELSEILGAVHVVDRRDGRKLRLAAADCGLGYRQSHFKGAWRDRYVVTAIELCLRRCPGGAVRYPELNERLSSSDRNASPTLAEVRDAVLAIRRSKSMVLDDPGDPNRRSAGSFFVNPVVDAEVAAEIRQRGSRSADGRDLPMPTYPLADGRVKLSAAWLIEAAGFRRGYRLGRAAISSRHALALVSRDGATAADIVALASRIRRSVRATFGVTLEPEPVFFGFGKSVDELLG